ncbi:hypothetical protein [Haladaptatus sp. CMAA 1911]
MSGGELELLVINVVAINLSSLATFPLFGYRSHDYESDRHRRRGGMENHQ